MNYLVGVSDGSGKRLDKLGPRLPHLSIWCFLLCGRVFFVRVVMSTFLNGERRRRERLTVEAKEVETKEEDRNHLERENWGTQVRKVVISVPHRCAGHVNFRKYGKTS